MSVKTCSKLKSKGILYLYNELGSGDEVEAYRQHLQHCVICQENLKYLESLREFVKLEIPSESCIRNIIQKAYEQIHTELTGRQELGLPTVFDRIFIRIIPIAVTCIIFVLLVAKILTFRSIKPLTTLPTLPDSQVEMLLSGLEQKLQISDDESNMIYSEMRNIEYKLVEIVAEIDSQEL